MAAFWIFAAFFLYSNIIFPISIKAENFSSFSDYLNEEVLSGFNVNNGKTHLLGLENNEIRSHECDCGSNSIDCRYDKMNGNICLCEDGYSQKNGRCESCYCGYESKCTFINNKKTCYCNANHAENHGFCKACKCGNWGSKGCSFVNGVKYCHCSFGFVEKGNTCESCDCGDIWSFSSCSFTATGNKTCNCNKGYVQRNGTCKEACTKNDDCLNDGFCQSEDNGNFCNCPEHFTGDKCETSVACKLMEGSCLAIKAKCKFNKVMRKAFCECPSNTAFNKERKICQECYCKGNAICTFENGEKTCHCKEGYSLNGDKCEKCDCGYYGKSCKFKNNKKVCTCRGDNVYFPGSDKCEFCSCGAQSTSCELNGGKYMRCTCKEGYVAFRSGSNENETCVLSESVYWRYATYTLIGILILIIFSCILKACCKKRKNKKKPAVSSSENSKDVELSSENNVETV